MRSTVVIERPFEASRRPRRTSFGRVLEAVQVAGDLSVRLQNQDDRRVRELLLALDVVVLKPDGVGDAVDVRVVADEERPRLGRPRDARSL